MPPSAKNGISEVMVLFDGETTGFRPSIAPLAMNPLLRLAVVTAGNLAGRERKQVVRLCTTAFEVDYSPFLTSFEIGRAHV